MSKFSAIITSFMSHSKSIACRGMQSIFGSPAEAAILQPQGLARETTLSRLTMGNKYCQTLTSEVVHMHALIKWIWFLITIVS